MPDPIVVRVTATPDAVNPQLLNLSINLPLVFLSLEDDDQVRWVCNDGDMTVTFAPVNNPFDVSPFSSATYQTQPDGSVVSGSLVEAQLDPNPDVFKTYKYTVNVTSFDKTRVGVLDPTFRPRRNSVYRGHVV